MAAQFEPIVGRYMTLALDGRPHRIYFEEAGEGIPLLCLHTAGADGRQFRHLMLDEEITRHYRVLAFDMPWHGKSLPPEGWQKEEYRLTTAAYTEMIVAFCRALELHRPVVMGCSIGGRIVLNLAIECAAMFRALIGLEAADFQTPWYDTAWLNRPDVHGGEVCAALGLGPDRAAKPGRLPPRDAVDVSTGRLRRVQGRSLFLPCRRRPSAQDRIRRYRPLSALSLDRRVRLLLHAGGYAAHRRRHSGRAGHDHAGARAFPHE